MNFKQFTRTVLLAQGDFDVFLKSKDNEKASILEKITGTEIYSQISKRVYQRNKSENELLDKLNEQKETIEILNKDEIKELKKEELKLNKNSNRVQNKQKLKIKRKKKINSKNILSKILKIKILRKNYRV